MEITITASKTGANAIQYQLAGAGLDVEVSTGEDLCALCQEAKIIAVVMDRSVPAQKCKKVERLIAELVSQRETKQEFAGRLNVAETELIKQTAEHGKTLKKLHETESELNKKTRDHAVAIGRLERAVNEISKLKENASISRPAGGTIRIKHDLWQVSEIASLGWDGDRIVSVLPKTSSPRMMYYFSGAMEAWAEYEIARQAFEKNLNAGLQTAENGEG